MSAAGQPPTPPAPPGPCQARIQQIWTSVWQTEQDGGVFEPLVAIAESELASFATAIPAGNQAVALDLQLAQNWHLFQSRHFAARLAALETYRAQIQDVSHQVYDQMAKFNEHAVRSLTLAHGGIVIAALAYIQAKETVPFGMVKVISLCSFGYLLTILGSHLVVALSGPVTNALMVLRTPRISEAVRTTNVHSLNKATKRMTWISRPVFYLSAICLIAALFIGISSLVAEKNGLSHAPASKAYLLG